MPPHVARFVRGADMSSTLATRASLLLRIRDPQDRLAWGEFVGLYAPLIHAYGRRRGLQDSDAADLTQEVLCRVARSAAGSSTIRRAARFAAGSSPSRSTRCGSWRRGGRARPAGTGDSDVRQFLEQQPDEREEETVAAGLPVEPVPVGRGEGPRASSAKRPGKPSGGPRCWPKTSTRWRGSWASRRVPSTSPAAGSLPGFGEEIQTVEGE